MSQDENAVVITNLVKEYSIYADKGPRFLHRKHLSKKVRVLDDINLTIKKGEIIGIMGRNGCGKSTLLKIIAGILDPTKGNVEINGRVVSIMETGMPFQNDLTGIDNIYLRGMYYGLTKKRIDELLDTIVSYSELGDAAYSPVRMYSTGMRSRLAFSIIINIEADIYIIDEALNAGDVLFNRKSIGYLEKLARNNKTIIFTSHSPKSLEQISGRAVLIDEGRVAVEGRPEDVYAKYLWSKYRNIDVIQQLADSGDPQAQLVMAKFHYGKDDEKYRDYLKRSAENGYKLSMIEYSDICFDEGRIEEANRYLDVLSSSNDEIGMMRYAAMNSDVDTKELIDFFKQISEKGNHFDTYRTAELMRLMTTGLKTSVDTYETYMDAYKNGNKEAGYFAAVMLFEGYGVRYDMALSLKILTELAEEGHKKSCIVVAQLYSNGMYVEVDNEKAFKYTLMAAKCGDAKSQFKVARMYDGGIGTEMDKEESKRWLGIYVKNKISRMLVEEAKSLEYCGQKTELDQQDLYKLAMEGYNETAIDEVLSELSLSETKQSLDRLSKMSREYCASSSNKFYTAKCKMDPRSEDYDEKEAFRQMKIAADAGNPRAMFMLANMYKSGFGTEKDGKMYNLYLRAAARKGNYDAKKIIDESRPKIRRSLKKLATENDELNGKHNKR